MANLNLLLPILRVLLQILSVVVSSLEKKDSATLSNVSNCLASCDFSAFADSDDNDSILV